MHLRLVNFQSSGALEAPIAFLAWDIANPVLATTTARTAVIVIPALGLVLTLRDIPPNPRVTAFTLNLLCHMDRILEVVPALNDLCLVDTTLEVIPALNETL
jgi:hypothetical protein